MNKKINFLILSIIINISISSLNLENVNTREENSLAEGKINLENSDQNINILYFDYTDKPLVQKYIKSYQTNFGKDNLKKSLDRGKLYLSYISKVVDEKNVPLEVIYLPLIESNFFAKAISRSGAKGLWQFMMNSINGYDLSVTEWHDERSDIIKSTNSAIDKLIYNYSQTNDWLLAIAAYNCGLGKIKSVVQQTKIKDYWILSEKKLLSTETINYIPKLLAATYICNDKKNSDLHIWQNYIDWREVKLEKPINIINFSNISNIPIDLIKLGNPELRYNITPPDKNYTLKIPEEYYIASLETLNNPNLKFMDFHIYNIKQGDTLYALCNHYKISLDMLLKYNNISPKALQIGQKIFIPKLTDVAPYKGNPIKKQEIKIDKNIENFKYHTIIKDDTLWKISKKYGIDIEQICSYNNIKENDVLKLNSILKIPEL